MPDSCVSPTWEIREGDALERLRDMPEESVHCCITSPPYYGLRDYGIDGQLGLEDTLAEYVERLVVVFEEVRRILRVDGTLWLNLGDSYAGSWGAQGHTGQMVDRGITAARSLSTFPQGKRTGSIPDGAEYKPKDLLGVPWTVAFALRGAGWWLRQEIIWHKLAPMPESVQDRCTRAHEQLFMLARSARYFYDAAAIAEPAVSERGRGSGNTRSESLSRDVRGQPYPWTDVGGMRNKRDVWPLSSQPFPQAHFATFPPALVEPCILAGCPADGIVLDPFAGAGTTGLVALRRGRSFVGIELNPKYAEMARRRICDDAPLLNGPAEVYAADGHSSRSISSMTAAGLR
jgi:DNA modification methylase